VDLGRFSLGLHVACIPRWSRHPRVYLVLVQAVLKASITPKNPILTVVLYRVGAVLRVRTGTIRRGDGRPRSHVGRYSGTGWTRRVSSRSWAGPDRAVRHREARPGWCWLGWSVELRGFAGQKIRLIFCQFGGGDYCLITTTYFAGTPALKRCGRRGGRRPNPPKSKDALSRRNTQPFESSTRLTCCSCATYR
jgi:hypothetical protein